MHADRGGQLDMGDEPLVEQFAEGTTNPWKRSPPGSGLTTRHRLATILPVMGTSRVSDRVLWTSSAQVASFLRRMAEERDEEAKRIGRLIAQLRLARGWTQETLAPKVGVGVSTVSRWERGENAGESDNMRKLAAVFAVEPSVLLPVEPDVVSQYDRIETALATLDAKLDAVAARVDAQAKTLDALVTMVEERAAGRIAAGARRAQRQAPGTPRKEDQRGQG